MRSISHFCWANSAVQMMSACSTSHSGDFAWARWMNWLRTSVASEASSNFFTVRPGWSLLKRLIASVSAPLVSLPAHIVTSPLASLASASVGAFFAPSVAPFSAVPPPLDSESLPHPAASIASAASIATIHFANRHPLPRSIQRRALRTRLTPLRTAFATSAPSGRLVSIGGGAARRAPCAPSPTTRPARAAR